MEPLEVLEKQAFLDELKSMVSENRGAIGGATGLAAGGALALVRKKGVRRHLQHYVKSLRKAKDPLRKELKGKLPESAVRDARRIANSLREQGIDPSKARIAVSGIGGTGKTTMSRALAQELKMKHVHLDSHQRFRNLWSSRYINKYSPKKGTISEQTHLINRVDPDKFDVVVHMRTDPKNLKKQVMKRGRGAYQLDLYKYDKLNDSLDASFKSMQGKQLSPVKGVNIKLRGAGGFGSRPNLERAARQKGVRPHVMSRQRLVNSVAKGKTEKLDGILPYLKPKALNLVAYPTLFSGVGAGAAGATRSRNPAAERSND